LGQRLRPPEAALGVAEVEFFPVVLEQGLVGGPDQGGDGLVRDEGLGAPDLAAGRLGGLVRRAAADVAARGLGLDREYFPGFFPGG
jgi:hypothetical protein